MSTTAHQTKKNSTGLSPPRESDDGAGGQHSNSQQCECDGADPAVGHGFPLARSWMDSFRSYKGKDRGTALTVGSDRLVLQSVHSRDEIGTT